MVSVADIAKTAFDSVAASISDAILTGTINGTDTGRVVFGGEKAPGGFPIAEAKDKTREAYLEGFTNAAAIGDTLVADGKTWHILSVRDIVEAGGFVVARVLDAANLIWATASFERMTNTSDGAGGYTKAWAAISGLGAVSVGIMGMSGSERWASQRVEAVSQWRLWCKGADAVTEADSVVVNGRRYQVRFVNDVEKRGVWHVMDLSEGAAA